MNEVEFKIERMILKLGNQLNYMRDIDLEQKNLTTVQSETMLYFGANEGTTASNLKDHLRITHQAARNIVERLKSKNYLYTTASENDGRANAVFLTEEGKKMYSSLKENGNRVGKALLAGFSKEEKEMLLQLIEKASVNME
ncbi:MarR family winged helix-turn-helix transcriptional regulator [Anaerotignum sp.]